MRFDTTPHAGVPRPSDALVRAAMRAVPVALSEDVLTIRHALDPWPIEWLVASVVERDHPEAAARWAIHNLAERGMFHISDDGEIDLSSAEALFDWWREGAGEVEPGDNHFPALPDPGREPTVGEIFEPCIESTEMKPAVVAARPPMKNLTPWHIRSRARVASGLLLTSPDVSLTCLGRELLADQPGGGGDLDLNDLSSWGNGLESDKDQQDHLQFTHELVEVCAAQPALLGPEFNLYHEQPANGVIAFHRWLEEVGHDVVVVASLNESTWWNYQLGFPLTGAWREIFNSDVYENWINPHVAGNGGQIMASPVPMHGLPASAQIVMPANSILIFVPG